MEITKDNYDEMEGVLMNDIDSCDFLSLDLELTGINTWSNNILDFPEHRYSKYRQTAERFRIIQLGLCLWKKVVLENQESTYIAKPYNIYVFPEDYSGNQNLNCETAAIIFNRDHKMDFNKWIYKGLPYLNAKQESTLFESLTDGNLNYYDPSDPKKVKNMSLHKEEDKIKYNEFCKIFTEFLYSEEKCHYFERYPKYFLYYILNNTQENIRKRLFFSFDKIEDKSVFVITKVNETEKKQKLDLEFQEKSKELQKKKGVRRIFEAIVNKKTYFVGHNCNLDLMFTISHFGDNLPQNLKEFKDLLLTYFSAVYDTKFVFENYHQMFKDELNIDNKGTHLENIYTILKNKYQDKVKIVLDDQMKNIYSQDSGVYHEAAFDAFVTGSAFIWMAEAMKENLQITQNKLFLMNSIYSCFNLNGEEVYLYPDTMAYCLKAIKQTGNIDLKSILEQRFFERIKRCHNIDVHNSLLILVQLDTAELMTEFETIMGQQTNLFDFYHFYKFKQLLKEEEDKKNDLKKNQNFGTNNGGNNNFKSRK